ncbi:hypothetical protein [Macrococcus equi]|uniref:hypothetical protein n=1 Tax=Macrococcus equi TaxID=3395462 RepID=UPI0039BDFF89
MINENKLDKESTNIISTLKEIYNRTIIDEFDKKFKDAQSPIEDLNDAIEKQEKMLKTIVSSTSRISKDVEQNLDNDHEEEFSNLNEKLDKNIKFINDLNKNLIDLQANLSILEEKTDNNVDSTSTLLTRSTKMHKEIVGLKSQISEIEESNLANSKEISKKLLMINEGVKESINQKQNAENTKDSQLQLLTTEVEKLSQNETTLNNKIKNLSFVAYVLILFEVIQIVLHFI